ncbi:glycoside hydrolase [Pasteurellaceae bacterium Macca]|nr:glycoside hydrolase [Pasteurellaceae bacterium Macca]
MLKNKKLWGVCSVGAVIAILLANPSNSLRTSQKGLEIIGNAEGCQQRPYQCPADVLTVGIGSTQAGGQKIERNKIYTLEEIAQRWQQDLKRAEQCVNQYGNGEKMPQGAFEAMVSLTFNVGCGAMKKSTLFKLAQKGYSTALCDEFSKWVYANGKQLNGLIHRREKERALCLETSQ